MSTTAPKFELKNLTANVGTIAISTIDIDSWSKEQTTITSKNKKTKGIKEIIHPVFFECAKVVGDSFWIDKFNNAAIGKFPPKFYYNNGILIYRKGSKHITLNIPFDPTEAVPLCIEFFRVNAGIFSPLDEQQAIQYSRAHDAIAQEDLTWKTSKKIQESLISYYVNDMKDIMSLTNGQMEQLRQIIKVGISNKLFGVNNIKLENNRIYSIDGLLWNDQTKIFYINPEFKSQIQRGHAKKTKDSTNIDMMSKDSIPQFGSKWTKYVESLDKKITVNIQRQNRLRDKNYIATSPTTVTSILTTEESEE